MLANLIQDGRLVHRSVLTFSRLQSTRRRFCPKSLFIVYAFGRSEPYLSIRFRAWSLRTLLKKARIHIPNGAFLLGVVGMSMALTGSLT
jgi:hypothetical protein